MPLLNKSKPSLVQYRSPGLKTAFSRLILGWPIALLPLLAAGNGRYDSLLSNAPKLYPFFGSILLLAPPTQSSCSCAIWAHNLSLRNVCNSIPHWFATSGRGAPCCASQLQFSSASRSRKRRLRGQYWNLFFFALPCGMKLNQVNTPLPARRSRAVNRSSPTKSGHPLPFCSALGPEDVWISCLLKETKETWGAHLVLKVVTTHTRILT